MPHKIVLIYFLFLTSLPVIGQTIILEIQGANQTETKTIDSLFYKKKHSNYQAIVREIDTVGFKLNKLGYIEHRIKPRSYLNDSTLLYKINLNKKYDTLYIHNPDTLVDNYILKQLTKQVSSNTYVIPFNNTETILNQINLKLSEQGHPFIQLRLSNIEIKDHTLQATLIRSQKKQSRTINHIIIKGYEKFPKKYIKHYAKIKTGDVLNLTKITAKAQLLNQLPFANLIRDPEVLFTKDSTSLYIYVEKQKSNSFDGYLGFTTNETTNKLEFSGYLDMQLQNNLNFGETLKLNYRSDENEQRNFNVNIDAPYLFKSPMGTLLELNIFKKDSSFTTVDQILKLYYQFNPKNKVYLGFSSTQSNNLLDQPSQTNITDYNTTFFETQYNYTNRTLKNLLFPIKTFAEVQLAFGNRTISTNKQKQSRFKTKAQHSFYLNAKNSIFTKLEAAALISDNYLDNELFRFGGINSIRGFEENSLYANLYGVLNLEYRLQLNKTIYIHSITDFGYLENQISQQKEKLLGLGVGFAILTKAGLLKFNYANGQTQNQPFNISNSKIHLSITSFF